MEKQVRMKLRTVVLDCSNAEELCAFYEKFLGWKLSYSEPGWLLMRDPSGGTGLAFQTEEEYEPPKWPEEPGSQQKMEHLDFLVEDLKAAAQHATDCGATLAPTQFLDFVKVFFDPAGHPFCLFEDPRYVWDAPKEK